MRRMGLYAFAMMLAVVHGAHAADHVTLGTVNGAGDALFHIAEGQGYFKAADLDVDMLPFDSAARMIAPLSTGGLDVGGGAVSASLFNVVARAGGLRIVADRSRMAAGYETQRLMIRKALIESGAFKSYADLAGKKIAVNAAANGASSALNEAGKKGGVAWDKIDKIYLNFPSQVAAFSNGAIDGALIIEPFASAVLASGTGVSFASTEDFYPGDQVSLLFYGEAFAKQRPDVARRFMVAYLRAVRDFLDVVDKGRFVNSPKGDAILALVAKGFQIGLPEARAMWFYAVDPDIVPNVASIEKDLAFFRSTGDVTDARIGASDLLDLSFAKAAVQQLGPYRPAR